MGWERAWDAALQLPAGPITPDSTSEHLCFTLSIVQSHPGSSSPVLCLHETPHNNIQLESVFVPHGAAAVRGS